MWSGPRQPRPARLRPGDRHHLVGFGAGVDRFADLKGAVAVPQRRPALDQAQALAREVLHLALVAEHLEPVAHAGPGGVERVLEAAGAGRRRTPVLAGLVAHA